MGSPDCSQCLGREDLGHLCVWNDGCRLRGPLQPLPGTCPAPEIRAVSTPTETIVPLQLRHGSEVCGCHLTYEQSDPPHMLSGRGGWSLGRRPIGQGYWHGGRGGAGAGTPLPFTEKPRKPCPLVITGVANNYQFRDSVLIKIKKKISGKNSILVYPGSGTLPRQLPAQVQEHVVRHGHWQLTTRP